MKTALWLVLLFTLSACWAFEDRGAEATDKRDVIGHRGGVVVRAGDFLGSLPFPLTTAEDPHAIADATVGSASIVGEAPCLPGMPCCGEIDAAGVAAPESKNPAVDGKSSPTRRSGSSR